MFRVSVAAGGMSRRGSGPRNESKYRGGYDVSHALILSSLSLPPRLVHVTSLFFLN